MKNKKNLLLLGGVVLVIVVLIVFNTLRNNKNNPALIKAEKHTDVKAKLSNDQALDLTEQSGVNETNVNGIKPYTFEAKNTGDIKETFEIVYEDFVSDDGKEHLDRTYLLYQLKSGNDIIVQGKLIDVQDNILAKEEIDAKTTKKYELKVWVDPSIPTSEWVGKSYSYNVFVR